MKIREAIEAAIQRGDVGAARVVADVCRLRHGLNYQETFDVVQSVCPEATAPRWDALLYAADEGY